jgi:hypothetical protein
MPHHSTLTTDTDPDSQCDVRAETNGVTGTNTLVRVTCRRVPLEPGILLTPDQWSHLASRLTAGELPDFAVELPNSWVTKIAPPGQEPHALYLWRDEIAALAHEIRTGHHTRSNPTIAPSMVEIPGREQTPEPASSATSAAAARTSANHSPTATNARRVPVKPYL